MPTKSCPFSLSLSKCSRGASREGYDRLSPNGEGGTLIKPCPFALSLSKCSRGAPCEGFDRLSPNGKDGYAHQIMPVRTELSTRRRGGERRPYVSVVWTNCDRQSRYDLDAIAY